MVAALPWYITTRARPALTTLAPTVMPAPRPVADAPVNANTLASYRTSSCRPFTAASFASATGSAKEVPAMPSPLPTETALSPGVVTVMVKFAFDASSPAADPSLARTRTRALVVAAEGTVQA